ncbi:unnamed protein product [Somion occarium]|uniref:GRIP domain-containing protein n=1 Tax=Somion occarium TaxID=3059160 RepID=A0ABP1CIC5_9APHY
MFTQWRQAVESLAQPQHSPKPSQDGMADDNAARSSLDAAVIRQSLSSSTQLAESALTSLKKSLVAQRSISPAASKGSPPDARPRSPATRTTLEDRLRAKFTIGDASPSTSPNPSMKTSRVGSPVIDHPLSPSSTPLPASPSASMEIKRPFSPASTPLPDSPALVPTSASQEEVVSHSLSESPSQTMDDTPAGSIPDDNAESLTMEIRPEDSHSQSEAISAHSVSDELQAGDSDAHTGGQDEESHIEADEPPADLPVSASQPEDIQSDSLQAEVDLTVTPPVDETESGETTPPNSTDTTIPSSSEHVDSVDEVNPEPVASSELPSVESDTNQDSSPENHPNGDVLPNGDSTELPDTITPEPADPLPTVDVEGLQKRLKLVEQRFTDVSTSFKRLQAEKAAADRILRELTPLESVQETDALRDYIQNMNMKTEMAQDEIRRLMGKLTNERIEELRDIHRLESKSQSDQIDKLRAQVEGVEALLKASQTSVTQSEEESVKWKAEIERLRTEVDRAKGSAKEEEEKRVKAIALLKTVRQKLVKAEKDRDDALKEAQGLKEKEKEEREKEKAEQQRLLGEVQKANNEREVAVSGLKVQFDREVALLKERQEKEMLALRGQFELEVITVKASHSKELDTRNTRISELQTTVQTLSGEKYELFDQLQMRQAELESSQSLLESLQGQTVEFQYQIREANDRVALLNEELADARQEQVQKPYDSVPSTEDVSRLLSAAETKYEGRIAELRNHISTVERERDEAEMEWSRKLTEKVKEIESLRGVLDISAKNQEDAAGNSNLLQQEIERLQDEIRTYQAMISDLRAQAGKVTEIENAAQTQLAEANARSNALRQQYEDSKAKEAQLKALNKTLRDELRKVQSSAALLEKQRNPGVGYWASRPDSSSDLRSPRSSVSDLPSQGSRPGSPATVKSDEEVNFEYLRNVILQFLEHKEMRPHLVRILSTILHFTPQETRRVISKV